MSKTNLCFCVITFGALALGPLAGCFESGTEECSADSCDESANNSQDQEDDEDESDSGKPAGRRDAGGGSAVDAGKKGTGAPANGGDAGVANKATGLPCEIEALIASHCGSCHGATPAFGAPMPLVSAADFQAASDEGKKMYEVVKERVSASDARERMPPASGDKLDAAQLATLRAWLDEGAPGGTCASGGPDSGASSGDAGSVSTEGLECYRFLAHAGDLKTPFKVGTAVDAYYNFTFAAPWKGTAYAVVMRPVIDNDKVIHHWLLFQDDVAGTPSGAVESVGAHPGGQLLHGWAPGGSEMDFRNRGADVGVELPGDTTYTVEYHYNSSDPNALDASGVEVCVAQEKPTYAAGLSWLGWDQLLIPADKWTGTCDPISDEPIHILSVTPHMHPTGVHMKATINRVDGTKDILHDEDFDFDYQHAYQVDATVQPGDTITTECTFSQPMAFGEGTSDEMCYLFTMAYPKGALADLGAWGSVAHGGSSCLGQ